MTTSVRASLHYTRNLGNFENVKIGYEIETDERLPGETVDQMKDRVEAKVNGWVQQAVEKVDREVGN